MKPLISPDPCKFPLAFAVLAVADMERACAPFGTEAQLSRDVAIARLTGRISARITVIAAATAPILRAHDLAQSHAIASDAHDLLTYGAPVGGGL